MGELGIFFPKFTCPCVPGQWRFTDAFPGAVALSEFCVSSNRHWMIPSISGEATRQVNFQIGMISIRRFPEIPGMGWNLMFNGLNHEFWNGTLIFKKGFVHTDCIRPPNDGAFFWVVAEFSNKKMSRARAEVARTQDQENSNAKDSKGPFRVL